MTTYLAVGAAVALAAWGSYRLTRAVVDYVVEEVERGLDESARKTEVWRDAR